MRRKVAAGNWKMNGTRAALDQAKALIAQTQGAGCDMILCPPATLLSEMSQLAKDTHLSVGAQDCHASESGAHTGDISAQMIADLGASYIIVGHSERRADHSESDADIAAKTTAVWQAGLTAIVCVGETLDERDAGKALSVVASQIDGSLPTGATAQNTIIAYEPVWAIGTGRVPSNDDIAQVHDAIRAQLSERLGPDIANAMRVLYGGSVKGSNANEIFAISNVDGGLVGGASLKADDFAPIVQAAS
jgi:triosephosphate isomerase